MKKILLLLLLITFSFSGLSQQKTKILTGKIIDSIGVVVNANIINLKNKQGTFSNEQGNFRIFASVGDTLQFSSVQHLTKKVVITDAIFYAKSNVFKLKINIETLDEFELRRNNLQGKIGVDIKDVPNNKKDSLLRNAMDFSNVDFSKEDRTIDEIEKVRPNVVNTMQGAMPMAGNGLSIGLPSKRSKKYWALRKELEQKKNFPYKIMSELGEKFFFDELKIPVDKYFHFLEYCNPLGIEKMHTDGKILDIIKILRAESKGYLKLIEKND